MIGESLHPEPAQQVIGIRYEPDHDTFWPVQHVLCEARHLSDSDLQKAKVDYPDYDEYYLIDTMVYM